MICESDGFESAVLTQKQLTFKVLVVFVEKLGDFRGAAVSVVPKVVARCCELVLPSIDAEPFERTCILNRKVLAS